MNAHYKKKMFEEVGPLRMHLFMCRVVAENDFLHSLLNKVTASRGDSGGQGTVLVMGFGLKLKDPL